MTRLKKKDAIEAWHFSDGKLRDGRPITERTYRHYGEIRLCMEGLHASRKSLHALRYAPGSVVSKVLCWGDTIEDTDKLVCTRRTVLWHADVKHSLRRFACECALSVIHLWDAPKIVIDYLSTCDDGIRAAARNAARDAARNAVRDAAWDAAWGATLGATREADWEAAWGAAWAVTWAAAWGAAWAAAWAAAWDAAWAAAREAQNTKLTSMLENL